MVCNGKVGYESKMTAHPHYRLHGTVFACLKDHEITIVFRDAGPHVVVPDNLVPPESRLPNSPIWITWSQGVGIIKIEARDLREEVAAPDGVLIGGSLLKYT
jgi:hypothetical protein